MTVILAQPSVVPAPPNDPAAPAPDTDRSTRIDASGLRSWPRSEQLAFAALLVATLAFYCYGLTANGYANAFYSAAAQAGSASWKALFFGSSDAGNSITVDKPPAALWVMGLSVKIFGLNAWAILLPEVLMGVASVGVLYRSVRRYVGHLGAMVAGVVLALTPMAVLMFRFNNPDALLVLLMLLGGWATLRAVERGSGRWFALVGVFLGLAFLTKTLQAFLVLPVYGLVYLYAAPISWAKRLQHSALALAAMIVSGGWWVAIVEFMPASARPYIGGSQTNSFWDLTFGYNGFGRINGNETGSVGGGNGWGTPGIFRMLQGASGGGVSWFLPTSLIFLVVGIWAAGRRPRTDPLRAAYLVWGGWTIVTTLTFSFMAGIYHDYYTIALAPGIAALVGLGVGQGWAARGRTLWSITLAAGVAVAAAWSFVLLTRVASVAYGPLRYAVLLVGLSAALLLLVVDRLHASAVPVIAGLAAAATIAGPAAYSASTVAIAHTGSIVTAGPAGADMGFGGGPGGAPPGGFAQGGFAPGGTAPGGVIPGGPDGTTPGGVIPGGQGGFAPGGTRGGGGMGGLLDAATPSAAVVVALRTDADRYRWAAATVGAQNAAGLQLGSGEPVMPIGGFNGSDPSPTLAQFQEYVRAGQIHYFFGGGGFGGARGGAGGGTGSAISSWVASAYQQVSIGGTTVYDLTKPLATSTQSEAVSRA